MLDKTGTRVSVEGDLQTQATLNTALFRRALPNLRQNAIAHSAPGAPILRAHLPRRFDRFYRVDASRHDNGALHGHGPGLAIVKAVANMHGGGVSARSEEGVTTIGFSVPAAASTTIDSA